MRIITAKIFIERNPHLFGSDVMACDINRRLDGGMAMAHGIHDCMNALDRRGIRSDELFS